MKVLEVCLLLGLLTCSLAGAEEALTSAVTESITLDTTESSVQGSEAKEEPPIVQGRGFVPVYTSEGYQTGDLVLEDPHSRDIEIENATESQKDAGSTEPSVKFLGVFEDPCDGDGPVDADCYGNIPIHKPHHGQGSGYHHKPDHHDYDHKPNHHYYDHKPDHHDYDHKPNYHGYDHKPDPPSYSHKPEHHDYNHKPDFKPTHLGININVQKPNYHGYDHKPDPPSYSHKPEHHGYDHKPNYHGYDHKPDPPSYSHKPEHHGYDHKPNYHEYDHKPDPPSYSHKPEHHDYDHKPNYHVYEHKPDPPSYSNKPEHHGYDHKPNYHGYDHKPDPPSYSHKPVHHGYDHKPNYHGYDHKPDPPSYSHKPEHHGYDHKPNYHGYDHKPDPPSYSHKPEHHGYDHKPNYHGYDHKPDPPSYSHKPEHHDYDHKPNYHEYDQKPDFKPTPLGININVQKPNYGHFQHYFHKQNDDSQNTSELEEKIRYTPDGGPYSLYPQKPVEEEHSSQHSGHSGVPEYNSHKPWSGSQPYEGERPIDYLTTLFSGLINPDKGPYHGGNPVIHQHHHHFYPPSPEEYHHHIPEGYHNQHDKPYKPGFFSGGNVFSHFKGTLDKLADTSQESVEIQPNQPSPGWFKPASSQGIALPVSVQQPISQLVLKDEDKNQTNSDKDEDNKNNPTTTARPVKKKKNKPRKEPQGTFSQVFPQIFWPFTSKPATSHSSKKRSKSDSGEEEKSLIDEEPGFDLFSFF